MHHIAAEAAWADAALLAAVRASVSPAIVGHELVEAWIVDDTGMPKKGRHAVGVAGQLGKRESVRVSGVPAPQEAPSGGRPDGGDCSGQPAGRLATSSAA